MCDIVHNEHICFSCLSKIKSACISVEEKVSQNRSSIGCVIFLEYSNWVAVTDTCNRNIKELATATVTSTEKWHLLLEALKSQKDC